jgi:hypothetical protein
LHRLVDSDLERNDAAGDLVEAIKNGDRMADLVGQRWVRRDQGGSRGQGGDGERGSPPGKGAAADRVSPVEEIHGGRFAAQRRRNEGGAPQGPGLHAS